jgi:hypothetical protein
VAVDSHEFVGIPLSTSFHRGSVIFGMNNRTASSFSSEIISHRIDRNNISNKPIIYTIYITLTMGTGGPFPGTKARSGRDIAHSPHLVRKSRMSRSYTSSPPSAFEARSGTALAYKTLSTCNIRAYFHFLYIYKCVNTSNGTICTL